MSAPGRPVRRRAKKQTPLFGVVATCILVVAVVVSGLLVYGSVNDGFAIPLKLGIVGCGFAAMVACIACHMVDPGMPERDPSDLGPEDEDDDTERIRERRLPDGRAWKQKWCRDCRLWRPHRCGHCHQCGRCVLRLDHHCCFMGTCVGERNGRFFAAFLLSSGAGIALLVALGARQATILGGWTRVSAWFQVWELSMAAVFLLCCPPCCCLLFQSVALTLSGALYTLVMLADTDLRSETSTGMSGPGEISAELWGLLTCRGLRTYCCGPVALGAPRPPSGEELQPCL